MVVQLLDVYYYCRQVTGTTIVCMEHVQTVAVWTCSIQIMVVPVTGTTIICIHTSQKCGRACLQTMVVQLLDDNNNIHGTRQKCWTCCMSDYGCRPVTGTTIICIHTSQKCGRAYPYRLWLSSNRMTIIIYMEHVKSVDVYVYRLWLSQ